MGFEKCAKTKKRFFTSEAACNFSGVQPVGVVAGRTLGIGGSEFIDDNVDLDKDPDDLYTRQ